MSSTNRGAERRIEDFYPTPPDVTEAAFIWLKSRGFLERVSRVVDPCAGDGAILRIAGAYGYACEAVELRGECAELLSRYSCTIGDALGPDTAPVRSMVAHNGRSSQAAVLTNPPFEHAAEFIATWAPLVDWSAWLLPLSRLGFMQPIQPSRVGILDWRPSFMATCKGIAKTKSREKVKGCKRNYPKGTRGHCVCGGTIGDGTDSKDYAWFLYRGRGARVQSTLVDVLKRP